MSRIIRATLALTAGVAALVGTTSAAHAGAAEDAAKAAREAANTARAAVDESAARAKLPETVVQLQVASSGKCLEINNGAINDGLPAQQWGCNPDTVAQHWRMVPKGGASYELRTVTGNKCLEVENSGTKAGAAVQQWTCGGGAQMRWQIVLVDPARKLFQVRPTHTADRCLDIISAKTENGVKAQSWYCNQSDAQLWQIKPVKTK